MLAAGAARAADPAPMRSLSRLTSTTSTMPAQVVAACTRRAQQWWTAAAPCRAVVLNALNERNKPGEAPGLANRAYDAGPDSLMDVQNSPITLAAVKVAAERHKLMITTSVAVPARAPSTPTTTRSPPWRSRRRLPPTLPPSPAASGRW